MPGSSITRAPGGAARPGPAASIRSPRTSTCQPSCGRGSTPSKTRAGRSRIASPCCAEAGTAASAASRIRNQRQPGIDTPPPSPKGLNRRRAGAQRDQPLPRLRRVSQPFLAAALRLSEVRLDEQPPLRPPLRELAWLSCLPRPEPDFLPPPDSLFTVAQARLSASFLETPLFS